MTRGKPASGCGERKAVISTCSDFREMGKKLGIFPPEEAGKRGDGQRVMFHLHLGREGGQARSLLGPNVEAEGCCARLKIPL